MRASEDNPTFDVLIVGAGAAGCVLAGRLSERPDRQILLIEAGPDLPAGEESPDILNPFPVALANPRFSWANLVAEVAASNAGGARPSRPFLQGFGVGGGSNIQGMIAFRGQPGDYEEWRERGAQGWGWEAVLPYFRKLERDLDFAGPLHGDRGPIPVRRVMPPDWAPFARAMGQALQRRGYRLIADYNAEFGEGVSSLPMSNLPDQRVSAAMGYLSSEVRARRNLTILPETLVEHIIVRDGCCYGVKARSRSGRADVFQARQTIVSCGAVMSPALLLRSGLGPADALRRLGIEVVRDLPGVGRHLQNHPKIELAIHLPSPSRQVRAQRGFGQNCLRYSSHVEGCSELDMGIVVINRAAWHALGRCIGALGIALYKPYSEGTVELVSSDPARLPHVRFNLLSDPRDFQRLVNGLRTALELLDDPQVAAVRNEAFFPDARVLARLAPWKLRNGLLAGALAAALDLPPLRKAMLKRSTLLHPALARHEESLQSLVRRHAGISHHVCGTCRMGRLEDTDTVVDEGCRVRAVHGLRVIDASVFPSIVRGNPHIPVLMVAERMADEIKNAWSE